MIDIQENVSLSDYSTMRLGGTAQYLAKPTSADEVVELAEWAKEKGLKITIVGSGANIVFNDGEHEGLFLVMGIKGLNFVEDGDTVTVEIGAGENWDRVVEECVNRGLAGIESLSLIPGTCGAAPVQNIGAYGQQIATTIKDVEVYDTLIGQRMLLSKEECNFRYRKSRFNQEDKGRFIVLGIRLTLARTVPKPPYYKDVEVYFDENGVDNPTVADVRKAVIAIRNRKLPNPKEVANCGSFFHNPIINKEQFDALQERFPELKAHNTDDGNLKLYAGQLVELAGFKGIIDDQTGVGTWPQQALVLVNYKATSTADVLAFRDKIKAKVNELFGIDLSQEPELI